MGYFLNAPPVQRYRRGSRVFFAAHAAEKFYTEDSAPPAPPRHSIFG